MRRIQHTLLLVILHRSEQAMNSWTSVALVGLLGEAHVGVQGDGEGGGPDDGAHVVQRLPLLDAAHDPRVVLLLRN